MKMKKSKLSVLSENHKKEKKARRKQIKRQFYDMGHSISLEYEAIPLKEEAMPPVSMSAVHGLPSRSSYLEDDQFSQPYTHSLAEDQLQAKQEDTYREEVYMPSTTEEVPNGILGEPITGKDESASEFEEDLQSILFGNKTFDETSRKMVSTGGEADKVQKQSKPAPKENRAAAKSEEKLTPKGNPHAVFDKMSEGMNYANTFDLGSINLEQTFDEFDAAIERAREEKQQAHFRRNDQIQESRQAIEEAEPARENNNISAFKPLEIQKDIEDIGAKIEENSLFEQFDDGIGEATLLVTPQSHDPMSTAAWNSNTKGTIISTAIAEEKKWSDKSTGAKILETSEAGKTEIKKYWGSLISSSTAIDKKVSTREAWSAAFICWVMKQAGVTETDGFAFHQRHVVYMAQALKNVGTTGKHFYMKKADAHAPTKGDLVCIGVSSWLTWAKLEQYKDETNRANITGSSHCDIFVEEVTIDSKKYLVAIGGNVGTHADKRTGLTVGKKYFELDTDGKLTGSYRIYKHDATGKRLDTPAPVTNSVRLLGIINVV